MLSIGRERCTAIRSAQGADVKCYVQAANVGSNPAQKPANPARDDVSDLPNPFSGNPANEAATKVCCIDSSMSSTHAYSSMSQTS